LIVFVSACSIVVAAQQKAACVFLFIRYIFWNHGTLRHTEEPWEGSVHFSRYLYCCHTSGISSMRNKI
jgi:hypothetical protein